MDWGAETSGGRGGVEPGTGLIERWTDGEYEREGKILRGGGNPKKIGAVEKG